MKTTSHYNSLVERHLMLTITQHSNGDGLGCWICVNYLSFRGSRVKIRSWQWLKVHPCIKEVVHHGRKRINASRMCLCNGRRHINAPGRCLGDDKRIQVNGWESKVGFFFPCFFLCIFFPSFF